MTKYGKTSSARLATCHPKLQLLFNEVIKEYDNTIICGHRSKENQMKAFVEKKSKLRWPKSEHNLVPSKAIDAAPWDSEDHILWEGEEAEKRFYYFAGYVKGIAAKLGIKIRWGGDWDRDKRFNDQNFNDLVHFELED